MGQNASSVANIAIPSAIRCFPYFSGEDELLCSSRRACDSLSQVRGSMRQIAGIAANPAVQAAKTGIFMSATGYLLKFLLGRLCNTAVETGEQCFSSTLNSPEPSDYNLTLNNNLTGSRISLNYQRSPSKSPVVGSFCTSPPPPSSPQPNNPQQQLQPNFGTLEEALVQVKIDKAIANAAVAELHAKLVAVDNRYSRLVSDIPLEDRRLEVVPALTFCEEILQLFRDPGHIFRKQPLITAPFLVTFGEIYISLAELSLALIESYKGPLTRQMILLQDTLVNYKITCLQMRFSSIRVKPMAGRGGEGSMIDAAFQGRNSAEPCLYLDDNFLEKSPFMVKSSRNMMSTDEKPAASETFNDPKEAVKAYKRALESKYDSFFEQVLQAVSSFSGFENVHNSTSSQFDDDDTN